MPHCENDRPPADPEATQPGVRRARLLVVEPSGKLATELGRSLGIPTYDIHHATSLDAAFDRLTSASFDVLVTVSKLGSCSGGSLIRILPQVAPRTAAILVGGDSHRIEAGAVGSCCGVRVMKESSSVDDVAIAVKQALEARQLGGFVRGAALMDVLQVFHLARRSLTVRLSAGALHFRAGEIVHAELGALHGELALREILSLPSFGLQSTPPVPAPVTIARTFQFLLLETLRQLGEGERTEWCRGTLFASALDAHQQPKNHERSSNPWER